MRKGTQIGRRSFLAGAAVLSATAACSSGKQKKDGRPNILFIMADDLGYADVSCYGRREYSTPHIDRLASEGMKFTDGYANSAVCSATRLALITGRYQYRLPAGLEEPLGVRNLGLPPDHPTMPSLLRKAGFRTALVGKWHLGALPRYGPLKSGYEEFWGIRTGGVDYFTHDGVGQVPDLWDGETPVEETGYMTDLLGDRALDVLDRYAGGTNPFLLSLHFTAPHWPWEGPDDQQESRRLASSDNPIAILHYDGGSMETYAAMVTRLDMQVGRVLDKLDQLGIADNTIVVFTSDNGGERFADNWPFRGMKSELLEGGIRVPTLVRWPTVVASGSTSNQPVMSMDWSPTLLAAAGVKKNLDDQPDGVDLGPWMRGAEAAERTLFWRFRHMNQRACRHGNWKYLSINGQEFLFDIAADPLERANLKNRRKDVFADLSKRFEEWEADMLPNDPNAFSHGNRAAELADHYGAPDAENAGAFANPDPLSD